MSGKDRQTKRLTSSYTASKILKILRTHTIPIWFAWQKRKFDRKSMFDRKSRGKEIENWFFSILINAEYKQYSFPYIFSFFGNIFLFVVVLPIFKKLYLTFLTDHEIVKQLNLFLIKFQFSFMKMQKGV